MFGFFLGSGGKGKGERVVVVAILIFGKNTI